MQPGLDEHSLSLPTEALSSRVEQARQGFFPRVEKKFSTPPKVCPLLVR